MRTVAVTAANLKLRPFAAAVAKRFTELSDFECLDLSGSMPWSHMKHPSWCKAWIWDFVPADVERIVWIDADCFPLRPMELCHVPDADFAALPDARGTFTAEQGRCPFLAGLTRYFNAGVFVARRGATEALMRELGERMHEEITGNCWDQSWFNYLVARDIPDWWELPREFNCNPRSMFCEEPFIIHFAGIPNRILLLALFRSVGIMDWPTPEEWKKGPYPEKLRAV